jgi:sugar/nucleoside kinase (ribokinase family)
MFHANSVFYAPAYPLEDVFDPTGAGDAFAGGFMGHVARTDDATEDNLRNAVVIGSVMGSFVVEGFSISRLLEISKGDIARRLKDFQRLVAFDADLP